LKKLPLTVAEHIAILRGRLRYYLDLDWRSSCLGHPFVRQKTFEAFSSMDVDTQCQNKVKERFVSQSREELEAKLFSCTNSGWPRKISYENLHYLYEIQKEGKGIILLTAHFDSSVAGSIFLGNLGFNVNIFYDEIVYDARVPQFFQKFFSSKYSAMQSHYNKGIFISKKNIKHIYPRLKEGQIFVWLSDILNVGGEIEIEFLHRHFMVPDAALRIALRTGSYVGAYIVKWEESGRYRMIFSKPCLPSALEKPEKALRECYVFLSSSILSCPERWWVADKMLEFKEV
jgi:lauroyl/myristoyl acyltransferase